MINPSKALLQTRLSPPTAPRQLCIAFDTVRIQGMTETERARAIALLANLLVLAAGGTVEERDDDEL